MPSIAKIIEWVSDVQKLSPSAPFMIHGKPGEGKSDCCFDIAANLNIRPERVLRVHLNQFDVVALGGVPEVAHHEPTNTRVTVFRPTDIFAAYAEGTGPGVIILEEAAVADRDIQQYIAGFVLERETSNFKLDPQVRILLTGNRAEDRSGAKPLLAHLNDRLYHVDMETNLDDWCAWAIDHGGVDHLGIAFLRLRPALLNDFQPDRRSNPTQRSWTKLFTEVPTTMEPQGYLAIATGKVGEGAAAEWVAARELMHRMPSVDAIRSAPNQVEVPAEAAVRFAISTALSMTSTVDTFSLDMNYMSRFTREFQMVYVTDSLRRDPQLGMTPDFVSWSQKNQDIFFG